MGILRKANVRKRLLTTIPAEPSRKSGCMTFHFGSFRWRCLVKRAPRRTRDERLNLTRFITTISRP
jgi:hypothetical protein